MLYFVILIRWNRMVTVMDDPRIADRVCAMETQYDIARKAIDDLNEALARFRASASSFDCLTKYLQSDLWRCDFEADEAGKLPPDLKRGVLSEDRLYDLLTDYRRLAALLKDYDDAEDA